MTVIGSNGAGKSTLLNALAGEVVAQAGRILISERDVTRWSAPRRSALVARVFQDPLAGTCESLTIEENLSLAAARVAAACGSQSTVAREELRAKLRWTVSRQCGTVACSAGAAQRLPTSGENRECRPVRPKAGTALG